MKNKLLIIAVFLLSHICTAFAENATPKLDTMSVSVKKNESVFFAKDDFLFNFFYLFL